ncbi:WSSV008 [White spot syndrome virus]|uniref:WSSV008 n=1 Tax=White spot syndrome virus TaxID=342409 RepID=A0A2I6SBE9_9VIRU|nr:WSSV008 [White spot syndrome virus]
MSSSEGGLLVEPMSDYTRTPELQKRTLTLRVSGTCVSGD